MHDSETKIDRVRAMDRELAGQQDEDAARRSALRHALTRPSVGPREVAVTVGAQIVVATRMEALKRAIAARDWNAVEWEWDRVSRALSKMKGEAR